MDILGLNFSVDSAAAMVRDGEVVAACQEERFTRIKHYTGFPKKAVKFCLDHVGKRLDEIDAVAFFWNPGIHAEALTRRFTSFPRHHLEYFHNVPANLLDLMQDKRVDRVDQILNLKSGKKLSIHYMTHHMCHAASAFYASPFDRAAILTADGYGERQSTLIARGEGANIEPILSVDFPHSIGALYAAFTQYLGFMPNSGEGKVMGLASYGKPSEFVQPIRSMISLKDDGFELDLRYFEFFHDRPLRYNDRLIELFGPERQPESSVDQRHMDIAFALQLVTEEILLHMAGLALKKTGSKKLCVSGGVALNCVANGRLIRESGFDEFFFYPSAGDGGSCVGAALLAYYNIYGNRRKICEISEYLGPSFSRSAVVSALDKSGMPYKETADIERVAARMLADGAIIGWFQGRSELGPRALGNRSILADPRGHDMKDLLNSKVKFRESFRPYAPSILEEACGDYFSSGVPSPFMLRTYFTLDDKVDVLPAITHVDGTARVQTVNRRQNPRYYRLIELFGELTGVPVVLNTSFNIRGEPIVNTVEEALRCFFTTGLDALMVEDFAVFKTAEQQKKYLG